MDTRKNSYVLLEVLSVPGVNVATSEPLEAYSPVYTNTRVCVS